jgi:hypothetical protein
MSAIADSLGAIGKSGRAMLTLAPRQAPATARRLVTAEQLMAPQCGIVLPRLDHIPVDHRFVSDDREIIRLAEILTDSNIAVADDWNESKRDPTKYVRLALQRWLGDHGGVAVDRRFDLEVVLSDRLVDYSDERGEEGTLYLIVDPDGAAFVLLNPIIELLGQVHPKLPATFFTIFVGSLNRWVRVYDYRDAEERVEMLREWFEFQTKPNDRNSPTIWESSSWTAIRRCHASLRHSHQAMPWLAASTMKPRLRWR